MRLDIAGYTYKAENLCAECTITALCGDESLNIGWEYDADNVIRFAALVKGINMDDEFSYDSDDFPKIIFHNSERQRSPHLPIALQETENCSHCYTTLWHWGNRKQRTPEEQLLWDIFSNEHENDN